MADIPPTRASLLLRLRDRSDATAWTQFVDLYAPLVYRHARSQGLQDADAADLTQEVLGAVANSVARLDYDPQRGSFRSWLFTIIRRKLSNWRRGQRHQAGMSNDVPIDAIAVPCPGAEAQAAQWESEWQERVFAWACEQARAEVTEVSWQAFWRTFILNEPIKQVAAGLEMSVAAVYLARHRLRARLKELVQMAQEP